jgi:hypothetical protein
VWGFGCVSLMPCWWPCSLGGDVGVGCYSNDFGGGFVARGMVGWTEPGGCLGLFLALVFFLSWRARKG